MGGSWWAMKACEGEAGMPSSEPDEGRRQLEQWEEETLKALGLQPYR